jgi:hypothetical protein
MCGMEMDVTGLRSCLMVSFGTTSAEHLDSATKVLFS